jgi:hypothetical protein
MLICTSLRLQRRDWFHRTNTAQAGERLRQYSSSRLECVQGYGGYEWLCVALLYRELRGQGRACHKGEAFDG